MSHAASHSFPSVAALHHADEDKFERHLISVARKCQDQDDAVDKALQEVEEAEEKRFPQKRIMNNYISMMLQSDLYQKIQTVNFHVSDLVSRFKQSLTSLQDSSPFPKASLQKHPKFQKKFLKKFSHGIHDP